MVVQKTARAQERGPKGEVVKGWVSIYGLRVKGVFTGGERGLWAKIWGGFEEGFSKGLRRVKTSFFRGRFI